MKMVHVAHFESISLLYHLWVFPFLFSFLFFALIIISRQMRIYRVLENAENIIGNKHLKAIKKSHNITSSKQPTHLVAGF